MYTYYCMMISILLIEKSGLIKETKIKSTNSEEFYKKCGFRKPDNFECRHTWNVKINNDILAVSLYSKDKGRSGTENKYDLPPPIDTPLYFGTMLVFAKDAETDEPHALTSALWEKIYEKLFGGFEDISKTDDEEEEDELENVPKEMKTKNGYLKDGFVVEDNMLSPTATSTETEETDTEEETDEENEDDEENFDSELEMEEYEYEGHN